MTCVETYTPDKDGKMVHDGYFIVAPDGLKWVSVKHVRPVYKDGALIDYHAE